MGSPPLTFVSYFPFFWQCRRAVSVFSYFRPHSNAVLGHSECDGAFSIAI
jgi:hypothetical protein